MMEQLGDIFLQIVQQRVIFITMHSIMMVLSGNGQKVMIQKASERIMSLSIMFSIIIMRKHLLTGEKI